jgi:ABC-type transporter Mla MlaB component
MNDTANPIQLELRGDLSVAGSSTLLSQFKEAFSQGSSIQVRFGEITSADLSCIQLLISASWTARDQGISFHLAGDLPDALERIARESATEHHIHEMILC